MGDVGNSIEIMRRKMMHEVLVGYGQMYSEHRASLSRLS